MLPVKPMKSNNPVDHSNVTGYLPPHLRIRHKKTPIDKHLSKENVNPSFRPFPFMQLPTGLRIRVYGLLFPDKEVPARFADDLSRAYQRKKGGSCDGPSQKCLRIDGQDCYTDILRVSRTIHAEAVDVLYGAVTFAISIHDHGVSACCNGLDKGQTGDDGSSRWDRFVSRVRSISVTVAAPYCRSEGHRVYYPKDLDEEDYEYMSYRELSEAYDVKDGVRWLVNRFTKAERKEPLRDLRINVSLGGICGCCYKEGKIDKIQEIYWVLEPFMALRGVEEVELVYPDHVHKDRDPKFFIFKRTLERSITSGHQPSAPPKVFDALPKLTRLVHRLDVFMVEWGPYVQLHPVRVAHDKGDVDGFLSYMPALVEKCEEGVARRRQSLEEDEATLQAAKRLLKFKA